MVWSCWFCYWKRLSELWTPSAQYRKKLLLKYTQAREWGSCWITLDMFHVCCEWRELYSHLTSTLLNCKVSVVFCSWERNLEAKEHKWWQRREMLKMWCTAYHIPREVYAVMPHTRLFILGLAQWERDCMLFYNCKSIKRKIGDLFYLLSHTVSKNSTEKQL